MLKQPHAAANDRPGPDSRSRSDSPAMAPDVVTIHNYDHEAGHSVHVTAFDSAGRTELTERCYLAPGQSRGLLGRITADRYRIEVRVDGVDRTETVHRNHDDGPHSAVVELGNGFVSVSLGPDSQPIA